MMLAQLGIDAMLSKVTKKNASYVVTKVGGAQPREAIIGKTILKKRILSHVCNALECFNITLIRTIN